MKCSILSDNLKKTLTLVERSTTRDITLPILSSFLITADNGIIVVTGTNLELGVTSSLRGFIQEKGSVVVPAKIFSSYISTLSKDEKVNIESKGNDVIIKTQSQETVLKGYQYEDFPPFPEIKKIFNIKIDRNSIIQALTKNLIAISRSTIKPELSSVYCRVIKDTLIMSSTDSFRLSEEKIKLSSIPIESTQESFLIPLRACEEIIKICEYSDENEVIFNIGNGEMFVHIGSIGLYSRLTEGTFPEYQQIIPQQYETSIVMDQQILIGHIRRASIFSNKLNSITFSFNPELKNCTVESSNRDIGDYKAEFPCEIKGNPVTIMFNFHYFLEGVDGFHEKTLFMGLNGDSSPLLMKAPKKENSLYIVMPMKGTA